jgi:hypothetical protein
MSEQERIPLADARSTCNNNVTDKPWMFNGYFLYLRSDIFQACIENGRTHADQFFNTLVAAPDVMAKLIDCTEEQLKEWTGQLKASLRGHVPDSILDYDPATAPRYAMGLRLPDEQPPKHYTGLNLPEKES